VKKQKKLMIKNYKDLTISNLDKIYWEKEQITKGDMIEYYQTISEYILPHLKNRALMLRRFPEGISGPQFYQKNMVNAPDWVDTIHIEHSDKFVNYVVVQNEKILTYVANLGTIELHAMTACIKHLQNPDYIVIDLDPEDVPFQQLVNLANEIHEVLEQLKIPNYCKTSGGRGLHIYMPTHAKYNFEQSEQFSELLAHFFQNKMPDLISLERSPKKRQKKIYIDYLQNSPGGRTMVASYSLRAKPGAPVSTPLTWEEVNAKLDPLNFNIKTVPERLKKKGDLFLPVLKESFAMKEALKKLDKLLG
jgi:bifunctional non-homologous end joining protein LigD